MAQTCCEADPLVRRGRAAGALLCGLVAVALWLPAQIRAEGQREAKIDRPRQAKEAPAAEQHAAEPKRVGWTIKITLPIDGKTLPRVKQFAGRAMETAQKQRAKPVLIFEFEVLPGQSEFGRGSEFGSASGVARFVSGPALSAATTVAYLPQSIRGHAVLVVLACDEIIMAPEATIGSAGIDENKIDPAMLSTYAEIAGRRKTVPVEVALGLLNPDHEVLLVETEIGREFVTPAGLKELSDRRTIQGKPEVLIAAGEAGEFSGEKARELGFVGYLASNRAQVARALDLPPEAVRQDPSLGEAWKAVQVNLKGPLDAEKIDQCQKAIEDEIVGGANFICLWIDSPGGSLADSVRLANFLATTVDPAKVRTVAYVPSEARSDAVLVAMACDEVVMHPQAVLDGDGQYVFSEQEIADTRDIIRDEIAPGVSRSWSLMAAMIDPDLDVFRYTRRDDPGHVEYFSEEELAQQPDPEGWIKGDPVTMRGVRFRATGEKAVDYWLARYTVDSFDQFKQIYGLEKDPRLREPGWADVLIDALASPAMAALLLMIAFAALYIELHAPGIGIGGFVAAVCFLLFFWSRFLEGTAGWLEVILFVAGLSFLLLEVFVLPGFGIFGLGGGLLVIASLILASQTFFVPHNPYQFGQMRRSLLAIVGAGAGVIASAVLLRRWLPRAPIMSQVLLAPPSGEEAETIGHRESLVDFQDLLGARGTTTTQLTPSGKARFGDQLIDVMADSEVIAPGTEIEIVEVHGNRVLVRAV